MTTDPATLRAENARLRNRYGAYDPIHVEARHEADTMVHDAIKRLVAAGLDDSDALAYIVEAATLLVSTRCLERGMALRRRERAALAGKDEG